jgi:ribosomal protein S18 acetylase RimI-like enzyme
MSTAAAIRKARPDDVAALVTLAVEAFRDTYRAIDDPDDLEDYIRSELTPAYFQSHLELADSCILLAERAAGRAAELIGYALVSRPPPPPCVPDPSALRLARLYLRQDVKGRGIGAALMRAVFEQARQMQAGAIWLAVFDRNTRARQFYRRWGFVDVGTKDFVFGAKVQADRVMSCRVGVADAGPAEAGLAD